MPQEKSASLPRQLRLLTLALCISSLIILVTDSAAAAAVTVKTVRRKAQKCDYTLVIQEFDPSLCPSVIGLHGKTSNGPAQGLIGGSTLRPIQTPTATGGNGTTHRTPTGPEALINYFNDGKTLNALTFGFALGLYLPPRLNSKHHPP